jgi:2-oxoglutarate dehydrogenase complex dehydrogenase (E1) component-like enzyme
MYDLWTENPQNVNSSWRVYFDNIDKNVSEPFQAPPVLG